MHNQILAHLTRHTLHSGICLSLSRGPSVDFATIDGWQRQAKELEEYPFSHLVGSFVLSYFKKWVFGKNKDHRHT